jgi:hypothetical protein
MALVDAEGSRLLEVQSGADVTVRMRFRCTTRLPELTFGLGIHTTDFFYLTTHSTEAIGRRFSLPEGEAAIFCDIRNLPLLPGIYQLRLGISDRTDANLLYGESLCELRVVSAKNGPPPAAMRDGVFLLDADWKSTATSLHDCTSAAHSLPNSVLAQA